MGFLLLQESHAVLTNSNAPKDNAFLIVGRVMGKMTVEMALMKSFARVSKRFLRSRKSTSNSAKSNRKREGLSSKQSSSLPKHKNPSLLLIIQDDGLCPDAWKNKRVLCCQA